MSKNNITIKDVARESGVSTATVSRVLNGSGVVSEIVREKVSQAVENLNYRPNAIARSLKQDKTFTIGILIPDITNPYFMSISRGIEDHIYQAGYNLIFCSGDEDPLKEKRLLNLLFEKRVDAVVLATSGKNEETIEKISDAGIPIILVDRRVYSQNLDLDLVAEDNVNGAFELTKCLIELGHQRIGLVNGPQKVSTGIDRYAGYTKAMEKYGFEIDPKLIYNGLFTQDGGRKAVQYFLNLKEKPSAILSLSNAMSFGVLLELTRKEYRVPEDMVVASYGEVDAAQLLKPPGIIYLRQQPYEMGCKVGEILLNHLNNTENGPFKVIFNSVLETKS